MAAGQAVASRVADRSAQPQPNGSHARSSQARTRSRSATAAGQAVASRAADRSAKPQPNGSHARNVSARTRTRSLEIGRHIAALPPDACLPSSGKQAASVSTSWAKQRRHLPRIAAAGRSREENACWRRYPDTGRLGQASSVEPAQTRDLAAATIAVASMPCFWYSSSAV